MRQIKRMMTKYNFYFGGNSKRYIVIHDVGTVSSAINNAKYFAGGSRGASAHYFVDNADTIQIIEDTDRAWHVGDAKSGDISNNNTIGIEMCLTGDLDTTIRHTVDLTRYLMDKYKIPVDRVVRHYDASGKRCPGSLADNNWAKWIEFKALVANKTAGDDGMKEQDVKNIVANEMAKVRTGILAEVDSKIEAALKPSKRYIGTAPDHWAHKDWVELNETLRAQGVPELTSTNLQDPATRGEVIRMLNLISKVGCKCK